MPKLKPARWPETLTPTERLDVARSKMSGIADGVTTLIALEEANQIIVYSPTLSSQIPRSRAAHGFNLFQQSSFAFQLVRTCALWDRASENRLSLPTIAALVDHDDVYDLMAARIRSDWPDDHAFGEQQRIRIMRGVRRAVPLVKAIERSPRLKSLVNHRDKNLAHSLSASFAEGRGDVIPQPKYGFERKLLRVSISLADRLYLGVSNTSYSWEGSRAIARGNARALWDSCRFEIASR